MKENAIRYNKNKPELFYALMFPAVLKGLATVYEFGTKRAINPYPKMNWTKGAPASELASCAMRHLLAFWNGEDMDPEATAQGFAVHHLDSAIGNLARLRQQIEDGRADLDDRHARVLVPKQENEKQPG